MSEVGFEMLSISNIEDTIRKPTDSYTNIMTGVFKKI
jgi:hypothetical protein